MTIKLITRGDDCGSNSSANRAIKECVDYGILKNVSIMAPCAKIHEAADIFKNDKTTCFGMHATFNAEWSDVKWGPVSPIKYVQSIVDENGNFFSTPTIMHQQPIQIEEVMQELQNQLDLLCRLGFNIEYMDSHMGYEVLNEQMVKEFDGFCKKNGLVNYRPFNRRLPAIKSDLNLVDKLILQLEKAPDGQYLTVNHPAYNDDEMRKCYLPGVTGNEVALDRDWQRKVYLDKKVLDYCTSNDVISIKYTEAKPI